MSAERGGRGAQDEKFRVRDAVGVTAEVGGLGIMAYNIILAGIFWPVAMGGAIALLGHGLVRSGRSRRKAHH